MRGAYNNFRTLNRNILVGGVTPLQTGLVSQVGIAQQGDSPYSTPLQFDGTSAQSNVNLRYYVLEHRGYLIPSQAGTYEFQISHVDDLTLEWIGEHALSEITRETSNVGGSRGDYDSTQQKYSYIVAPEDIGKPVPFRIFWANVYTEAVHEWQVLVPSGTHILGVDSEKNSQIVSSCSGPGTSAPAFPAWETEY